MDNYEALRQETGQALQALQRIMDKVNSLEAQMMIDTYNIRPGEWFSDGDDTWIVMETSLEWSSANCINAHGDHDSAVFGLAELSEMQPVNPSL